MSDRKIEGLPPVRNPGGARPVTSDLSQLSVGTRRATPTPPRPATLAPPEPPVQPAPTPPRPAETPAPARKPSKDKVTLYLDAEVNAEARLAHRYTGHLEGDSGWSGFVQAALEAETKRRRELYNNGRRFVGQDGPMTPGPIPK